MHNGYVAFLDVLGFSSLVAGGRAATGIEEYRQCLSKVLETQSGAWPEEAVHFSMNEGSPQSAPSERQDRPVPDVAVFSDSIILAAADDSLDAFQSLVMRTSRLFGVMLQANIALRGAISFGPYTRTSLSFGSFFAGRAIIDAYNFEQRQDWVGIMLSPSVVERVPQLRDLCNIGLSSLPFAAHDPVDQLKLRNRVKWASVLQPCDRIPFHGGHPYENYTYDGFAVVPTMGDSGFSALAEGLQKCLEALDWLKSLAPDPRAQEKYSRTRQWLYPLSARWAEISHWENRLIDEGKLKPAQV